MSDIFKIPFLGKEYDVSFRTGRYTDGGLFIGLTEMDEEGYGEPWGNVTVNLGKTKDDLTVYLSIENMMDFLPDWLESIGAGEATGNSIHSGREEFPEFEFDRDFLEEHSVNGIEEE